MPPDLDKIKEFQKELQALLERYDVALRAAVQVVDLTSEIKKEDENLPEMSSTPEEKE